MSTCICVFRQGILEMHFGAERQLDQRIGQPDALTGRFADSKSRDQKNNILQTPDRIIRIEFNSGTHRIRSGNQRIRFYNRQRKQERLATYRQQNSSSDTMQIYTVQSHKLHI